MILPQHQEAIRRIGAYLAKDKGNLAFVVGGSVAHGFAREDSDLDIMIFVEEADYQRRLETGKLTFLNIRALTACSYKGGYVDGKYSSLGFLRAVAEKGSDPARYAYKDAIVGFSRLEGLEDLLAAAARFPVEEKAARVRRFAAQVDAWYWYANEAQKRRNEYLLAHSIQKLVLFGGRLVLTYNERLFPYHKWFLRELEACGEKPKDFTKRIDGLLKSREPKDIKAFYDSIRKMRRWPVSPLEWPRLFMRDSELNWMDGAAPIEDL